MRTVSIASARPGHSAPRRAGVPAEPGTVATLPVLRGYFDVLISAYGPQKWWPGRTRFEIVVGAILTQNTSWKNVEGAILSLRRNRKLQAAAVADTPLDELAQLIRSSGYFRQKARKLKEFVAFLAKRYGGSLGKMVAAPTGKLRAQLLEVHGIGPETADSILLYAGDHPVFVVDAYTRRILQRHELLHGKETYEEIQALVEKSLPRDTSVFNEFHALIVHVGKNFCRPKAPRCSACPLERFLPHPLEGAR
ncbi:MAG: hypothetical protein WAK20_11805 [Candidatus Acidiferrum sp.]